MASDVLLFIVFFVSYLYLTFALLWYFVSNCISTIFVVDNFRFDVYFVNNSLLFGSLSIQNFLLFLFG